MEEKRSSRETGMERWVREQTFKSAFLSGTRKKLNGNANGLPKSKDMVKKALPSRISYEESIK
jgi:hypothetical protein